MSIRVTCPNGHALVVNDSFAGKAGLCPQCKARVRVPEPADDDLSEDLIMSILGPHKASPPKPFSAPEELPPSEPASGGDKSSPPKKSCHKCNREISAAIHICPFCHTYIAELTDF
ncbi:MAG TPA: hypothetical protein VMY42_10320 [Thermoguttaceae bacterium]|nr:hypothetical protein [Thermoguttaceae bacterium]